MPVFPLVGSSSSRPGSSWPAASAASTIALATRSLIDPVGFWPSSFAYRRTPGRGESRASSTSGVFPTRSSSDGATAVLSTRHRGEEDDRPTLAYRRLEPLARAHVLALDVEVHEGRELALVEHPLAKRGKACHQVVEQLADGRAVRVDLARSA